MKTVDLNVDIGEGFPYDADLLLFATSANICCGEHAGAWSTTQDTIGLALDGGIRIGMHPGYPDRPNMGRASMDSSLERAFSDSLARQIEHFFNFVPAAYLKPHGAFYNDSTDPEHPAFAILSTNAARFGLPVMGLPGTAHELISTGFIAEGFADRAYTSEGLLVPRSRDGAVLQSTSEIRDQTIRLAKTVDSICLHGDTPGCVELAELIYATLVDQGYEVAP